MNTWSGIGNLVRDPVSDVTDDGEDVCKFTIAVNRGVRDESTGKDIADFVPVRARKRQAQLCREYLRKGKKVGIVGALRSYNFKNEAGEYVSGFYVAMTDFTFLYSGDPKKSELGDVHADDGVVHNAAPQSLDFSQATTPVETDELPF